MRKALPIMLIFLVGCALFGPATPALPDVSSVTVSAPPLADAGTAGPLQPILAWAIGLFALVSLGGLAGAVASQFVPVLAGLGRWFLGAAAAGFVCATAAGVWSAYAEWILLAGALLLAAIAGTLIVVRGWKYIKRVRAGNG